MRRSSRMHNLNSALSQETGYSESSLRLMASRAHLTSSTHSLMCTSSEEEKGALGYICIFLLRREEAFSIPHFLTIASYFNKTFGKKGKITSPLSKVKIMLQDTKGFNSLLNRDLMSHKINEKNLFFFSRLSLVTRSLCNLP